MVKELLIKKKQTDARKGCPSWMGPKKLYEDRVFGIISDERYLAMSADYEAELKKMKDRYYGIKGMLDTFTKQNQDVKKFAKLVETYTDITEN